MADVKPPDPTGPRTSAGPNIGLAVLGGLAALPLCVVASLCGWLLFASVGNQQSGTCLHGFVPGIITVLLAGLLVWFAWAMLVRNRSTSGGANFMRGFSLTLAVFLLVPWPCSFTWAGVNTAISCVR